MLKLRERTSYDYGGWGVRRGGTWESPARAVLPRLSPAGRARGYHEVYHKIRNKMQRSRWGTTEESY